MQEIDRRLDAERQALIADTTAKAREAYDREPYITSGGGARSMELQYQLTDRATPFETTRQALAVIGRLGVTFTTEDDEHAVEQLGLIMVHAAVIATIEHLAVEPIIALGRDLTKRQDVQPLRAAATLATAANLYAMGREPRQLALVDGLALAIAKALDDCEIGHGLTIEPFELYRHIGAEVVAGKLSMRTVGEPHAKSREAAPGVSTAALPPSPSARRAEALTDLQAAADALHDNPGRDMTMAPHPEEPTARHQRPTTDAAGTPITEEHLDGRRPHAQLVVRTPRETISVTGPADADPSVLCRLMERELAHAALRVAEDDAFMSTVATDGFAAAIRKHKAPVDPATIGGIVEVPPRHAMTLGAAAAMAAWIGEDIPLHSDNLHYQPPDEEFHARAPRQGPPPGVPRGDIPPATAEEQRLGVSAATVCPQCAASMVPFGDTRATATSDPDGTVYRCSNGHEISDRALRALVEAAQQAEATAPPATERPAPVTRGGRHFPPPRKP